MGKAARNREIRRTAEPWEENGVLVSMRTAARRARRRRWSQTQPVAASIVEYPRVPSLSSAGAAELRGPTGWRRRLGRVRSRRYR